MQELFGMIGIVFLLTSPALIIILVIGIVNKRKVKRTMRNSRRTEGIITKIECNEGGESVPESETIYYQYTDHFYNTHSRCFRVTGKRVAEGEKVWVYYEEQNRHVSVCDIEVQHWNTFLRKSIPVYFLFVGICCVPFIAAYIAKK